MSDLIVKNLFESNEPEKILQAARPFIELMMQYECAMLEIQTKLEVLNKELSLNSDKNPFEAIICRIKKPISIINKLKKLNLEVTIENIEKELHDVAGIRVISTFPNDIYLLAEKLCSQDDIRLLQRKDYIKNPKPNGYRSLHLIVEIPVFFAEGKKLMQVEVQFRTIAMDFWASVEHKIYYKKTHDCHTVQIADQLRSCADAIHAMDVRLQEISEEIERYKCPDE
ncbi:MAG: GTP pyrophosphokinase [Treponema sp.]